MIHLISNWNLLEISARIFKSNWMLPRKNLSLLTKWDQLLSNQVTNLELAHPLNMLSRVQLQEVLKDLITDQLKKKVAWLVLRVFKARKELKKWEVLHQDLVMNPKKDHKKLFTDSKWLYDNLWMLSMKTKTEMFLWHMSWLR